jgi:hypothetical protein
MYNYCASNISVSSPRSVSTLHALLHASRASPKPIYHPAVIVHHLLLQSQYIGPLQLSSHATLLQLCCDHRRPGVLLPHMHYEHLQLIDRRASVCHYHLDWWWPRQGETWPSTSQRWCVWVRAGCWTEGGIYMCASGAYEIETSTMWLLKLNRW